MLWADLCRQRLNLGYHTTRQDARIIAIDREDINYI
nr:MAG TPA: hypothetical protein [Caudoviricetes sp.]